MNNALVSAGIGVTSGSVAALIQWVFQSFGHTVPTEAMPILVGTLVYVGHTAKGYIDAKAAKAEAPKATA
jgi:hypothetical protein